MVGQKTHALIGLLTCVMLLLLAPPAHAAQCVGPYAVGQRTLALADGREVAVWYPAAPAAGSRAHDAASAGVITDAPLAACPARWPLVLFSHGVAGCNEQVLFVTEQVASHGYVVAAPNHRDAICGVALRKKFPIATGATRPSFLAPQTWTASAWRGRMLDLRDTVQLLHDDARLARAIDFSRIGLMGHSLGGYTALGMAGGWPGWSLPGVRAVLAFAPFVAPLLHDKRLSGLRVPVMYQVADWDLTITPNVVQAGGAFDASPAPKYLVELAAASHLAWTNLPCRDFASVAACLAAVPRARQVDAYAIGFLDRYLKGLPAPLLDASGKGLRQFRAQR